MRCILRLSLVLTAGLPTYVHAIEIDKYWPQYATLEPELSKKYVQNKRIRFSRKDYSHKGWKEKHGADVESTIICSRNSVRVDSGIQLLDRDDKIVRGMMFDQDELYYLEQVDGTYTVKAHHYNTESRFELLRILSGYTYAAPLSFVGSLDLRRQFQLYDDPRIAGLRPSPKPITKATLDGKSVLKLTVMSQGDHENVAYYDPENSGALLRYESSHTFDIEALKSVAIRHIGSITYADSPLGYPVPKSHKCWYQKADGTIIRDFEVEYLEYENYTPKADDFDLETHYGLKPLPRPVKAPPSPIDPVSEIPERNSGLWIAVGILAISTAVLIVLIRRKYR